jgi:ubiquinone/menaquinone biosynthesis C-methylase UbiE
VDRLLEATAAAETAHFWFRSFRRFLRPLVARALHGVEAPRILDCGCGTGANLGLLSVFGHTIGVDLNRVGLEFARRKAGGRVARASVAHLPFPDATFDLVTSLDVLYSLDNETESAAVGEMRRVLRPGGAAIVNVAAMEVLRGNHSVLSAEVRRYSARTLRAVLERGGFRIEDLRYTNAVLFPVMLAVRVTQRLAGLAPPEQATREIRVPPRPINATLAALLAFEARAIQPLRLPFGSSLLCLATKAGERR